MRICCVDAMALGRKEKGEGRRRRRGSKKEKSAKSDNKTRTDPHTNENK